ncbi:MAG: Gfo/Idh/MocA family oxidoreductase [Acidobacteriaceae bacterium]|nr:Gfo/Idh/MocA family oxidoreductase [Acidobacteriaceae bacterium]MBV9778591.1 Gfo/Idh/MocA family oxidoreductase [Acidobacteriaceae bacterium]
MSNHRRDFLRMAVTAASYERVMGANERISLGVIGTGGRGIWVMGNFLNNPAIRVVSVCDVYGARIDEAREKAPEAKGFRDYRELLGAASLDAVFIAVPDHWHKTIAIDALKSGKDVYVEKPLTRLIEEGMPIVKAARENDRVCQAGMQQRSGTHYLQAKEKYFDSGKIGTVTLARTWWYGNSWHLRKAPEELRTKPKDLDWDRFLGPVAWRDYDAQQYYNWRAYLAYGGGQVTDLFTHWIDVVHMFTGKEIPCSATAMGGVYCYKDGRTAPDTINVELQYPGPREFTATFEATLVPSIRGAGIEICGTDGRLWIDRSRYEYYPVGATAPSEVVQAKQLPETRDSLTQEHVNNFVECVKTRRRPNGDVLIGHRSAQASHLGNIAYEQKRRIEFDVEREEILGA